jgi:hypothetical protein
LMTDSTTSAGWMRKPNFKESTDNKAHNVKAKVRNEAARKHASLYIDAGVMEYMQWFEGKANNVADSLSRDFHLIDDDLTSLLFCLYPNQLPQHFKIVPLPNKITSWLTSLLQKLPVKEQLREEHTRAKHNPGRVTLNTSTQSNSQVTLSSRSSTETNATISCVVLPLLCLKGNF